MISNECAPDAVSLNNIASKDTGDIVMVVETDIQNECRPGSDSNLTHFLPDRVAGCPPPGGLGIGDHGPGVIAEHAFKSGNGGQHSLGSTAESGKEMGLDETGKDL